MKLKNVSNYPKIVKGVRIEQGQIEEVSLDAATAQKFRGSNKFEVVEDTSDSKVEEDDEPSEDTTESSKSEEKINEEGE